MNEASHPISSKWLPGRLADPGALALSAGALAALATVALGMATIGMANAIGLGDVQGLYLVVLPALLTGAYLAWRHERIWIYASLLGHFLMFLSITDDGITPNDVLFTGLTSVGICIWLFKELAVHRRPIVRTGFDVLFLGTFITTSVVALIANLLNEGDLFNYLTEWLMMFDLMLYFPVRSILNNRRDVVQILVILAILGIANGIYGVITYRERLMTAVFAYQIEHSRVFANEPVSMIYSIFGVVFVAYAKTKWTKILGVLLTSSGLLFLIMTFSRGTILSAAIGITFVMFFSGHGRRIASVLLVSLVIGSGIVYLAYPNIAKTMAISVGKRLGTIGSTMTDVSFNLRVIEANRILDRYVPHSPIIGHGYGVRYDWYDPTEKRSKVPLFIHNGYVRLLFKYGYPLALLFLFFKLYPLLRLMVAWPSKRDHWVHALAVGGAAYMIAGLTNNYVSDMYSHYSGPLNYVLCWALLDFANRRTQISTLPSTEPPLAVAGA